MQKDLARFEVPTLIKMGLVFQFRRLDTATDENVVGHGRIARALGALHSSQ
jgi:hypothetical protein